MKWAIWGLIVAAGLFGLHRAMLWAERRGWVYYRKSGSGTATGNALIEMQAAFEPSQRHVIEERTRVHVEVDPSGDPFVPGPEGAPKRDDEPS